jgi:hypothetical protein
MKLTYRGVSYDYTPAPVEVTEGQLGGKYRGLDWRFCTVKKEYVQQPNVELKYRGVSYNTGASEVAETVSTTAPSLSASDKARVLMLNRHRNEHNRQRALLLRLNEEIGHAI